MALSSIFLLFFIKIMYGKYIESLGKKDDKYGFVNENTVRIEAGIALLGALYSSISVVFFAEFTLPMIIVSIMVIEFFLKIFISPQSSLFRTISNKTSSKPPYWVGALQKRFAWSIGLFLSVFVLFCMLILSGTLASMNLLTEAYLQVQQLPIPSFMAIPMNPAIIACILCITFMALESVFGYCVGCKIYQKFVQWGVMKKIPGQNCSGGVCEV